MLIYLSYSFYTNLTSLFRRDSSRVGCKNEVKWHWDDLSLTFQTFIFLRAKTSRAMSNCVKVQILRHLIRVELSRGRSDRTGSPVIDINRSPVSRFGFFCFCLRSFYFGRFANARWALPSALSAEDIVLSVIAPIDVSCSIDGSGLFKSNLRSRTRSFEACGCEEIWRLNRLTRLK